jgi:hypothetical protein
VGKANVERRRVIGPLDVLLAYKLEKSRGDVAVQVRYLAPSHNWKDKMSLREDTHQAEMERSAFETVDVGSHRMPPS